MTNPYALHTSSDMYTYYNALRPFIVVDESVTHARALYLIKDLHLGSITIDSMVTPKVYVRVDSVLVGYAQEGQADNEMTQVLLTEGEYTYGTDERPPTMSAYYTLNSAEMVQAIQGGLYDNSYEFRMALLAELQGYEFVQQAELVQRLFTVTAEHTDVDGVFVRNREMKDILFIEDAPDAHLMYNPELDPTYVSLQSLLVVGLSTVAQQGLALQAEYAQQLAEQAQVLPVDVLTQATQSTFAHVAQAQEDAVRYATSHDFVNLEERVYGMSSTDSTYQGYEDDGVTVIVDSTDQIDVVAQDATRRTSRQSKDDGLSF